jgi:hypothetical protein
LLRFGSIRSGEFLIPPSPGGGPGRESASGMCAVFFAKRRRLKGTTLILRTLVAIAEKKKAA